MRRSESAGCARPQPQEQCIKAHPWPQCVLWCRFALCMPISTFVRHVLGDLRDVLKLRYMLHVGMVLYPLCIHLYACVWFTHSHAAFVYEYPTIAMYHVGLCLSSRVVFWLACWPPVPIGQWHLYVLPTTNPMSHGVRNRELDGHATHHINHATNMHHNTIITIWEYEYNNANNRMGCTTRMDCTQRTHKL